MIPQPLRLLQHPQQEPPHLGLLQLGVVAQGGPGPDGAVQELADGAHPPVGRPQGEHVLPAAHLAAELHGCPARVDAGPVLQQLPRALQRAQDDDGGAEGGDGADRACVACANRLGQHRFLLLPSLDSANYRRASCVWPSVPIPAPPALASRRGCPRSVSP
ncbi:hypothetical protein PG996_006400 [Apiospora saccharicola]|uniref:Uncharacterized protein n=1 Tax=Apiospora saccharicola TaxID=335842 RepID=A0ABR1VP98_9PEZI